MLAVVPATAYTDTSPGLRAPTVLYPLFEIDASTELDMSSATLILPTVTSCVAPATCPLADTVRENSDEMPPVTSMSPTTSAPGPPSSVTRTSNSPSLPTSALMLTTVMSSAFGLL